MIPRGLDIHMLDMFSGTASDSEGSGAVLQYRNDRVYPPRLTGSRERHSI